MKKMLIILDGMDDEPNPNLGNLTPSHYADMPALRYMRKNGVISMQNTIPAGNQPGTDVAVLNILGYNIPENFSSRSWLEALGCGIEAKEDDLCLRCNLISHSNGLLTSHCGEGVSSQQCHEIIDTLNNRFGNRGLEFHGNGSFRNLLIVHDSNASIKANPPHTLLGMPRSKLLIESDDKELADTLNQCIIESRDLLKDYPANGISLWAPGSSIHLEKYKEKGALISAVNLMKGIGKAIGLYVPEVKGATGDENTDYRAKLQAALSALESYDFVLLHVEAPDEISHKRDSLKKVSVLEDIDRELLAPLLKENIELEVTVQSDHATSSLSGMHLDCPVEVVKFKIDNHEK